jgi:hypothetical protein
MTLRRGRRASRHRVACAVLLAGGLAAAPAILGVAATGSVSIASVDRAVLEQVSQPGGPEQAVDAPSVRVAEPRKLRAATPSLATLVALVALAVAALGGALSLRRSRAARGTARICAAPRAPPSLLSV